MDIRKAMTTYATMPVLSGGLIAAYRYYYGEELSASLIDGLIQSGAVILSETVATALTIGNHSNNYDNLSQIDKFRILVRLLLSGGMYSYYKAKKSGSRYDANNLMSYIGNNFVLSSGASLTGGIAESQLNKML